jgi:hypothetical protein
MTVFKYTARDVGRLWEARRSNSMGNVPSADNDNLRRLAGMYMSFGVCVVVNGMFAFHERPKDDSPWSGMLEWPDQQLTPTMGVAEVQVLLTKKGVSLALPLADVHTLGIVAAG